MLSRKSCLEFFVRYLDLLISIFLPLTFLGIYVTLFLRFIEQDTLNRARSDQETFGLSGKISRNTCCRSTYGARTTFSLNARNFVIYSNPAISIGKYWWKFACKFAYKTYRAAHDIIFCRQTNSQDSKIQRLFNFSYNSSGGLCSQLNDRALKTEYIL